MNGVSQHPRLDKPKLSALETTDPLDTPNASTDPEGRKSSNGSGYHSNSDSSSPSSSTCTPPLNYYRRTVRTIIDKVDANAIHFRPSNRPGEHPYEDPSLTISDRDTRVALEEAAKLLQNAQPVAFPTETVYGLGADATSTEAVRSIYSAKSRPADNPLIVHVASLKQLRLLLPRPYTAARLPFPVSAPPKVEEIEEETIPEVYRPLIDRFWPGPLTILLPLPNPSPLSPNVTSTQPTFAARMPRHPIALALAAISGLPLAAPSANASGRPSPTTAQHVFTDLEGKIPLIIDGGSADVGLESTVVDGLHDPPVILRPGGISAEEIRQCGGVWENVVVAKRDEDSDAAPRAPGMKYKHYSPRAGVVLYDVGARAPSGRDLIGSQASKYLARIGVVRTRTWREGFAQEAMRNCYEDGETQIEVLERNLGSDGKDISRGLFSVLRELDELGVDVIHVEGIEETDEGLAVMNRLGKAASVVVRKVE
jgi:L-threonylcarbamoyladenylate synthase